MPDQLKEYYERRRQLAAWLQTGLSRGACRSRFRGQLENLPQEGQYRTDHRL